MGTGISPAKIDQVIGVVKAYTTRVGEGPFPTEFPPPLMEKIRSKGKEFGATTGRPRRCGWFDAVLVRLRLTPVIGVKAVRRALPKKQSRRSKQADRLAVMAAALKA